MFRFTLIFLAWLVGLFVLELWQPVQQAVIIPFTSSLASLSAAIMQLFDTNVAAHGKSLYDPRTGFSVTIEAGCNGVEAGIILIAAMLAWPASAQQRAIGVAVGVASVQALNLVRIITLYYLGKWNLQWFQWAHLYLWQALIMLDVLVVWLFWLRWLGRTSPFPDATHAAA
jgi:exosortase H (IPTLxxWG-CTERM-specific)